MHGANVRGSEVPSLVLIESQIYGIDRLKRVGVSAAALAGRYGVLKAMICTIVARTWWEHVPLAA